MKIKFDTAVNAEIEAFIIDEGKGLPNAAKPLDIACGGLLTEAAKTGRFKGKASQHAIIVLPKTGETRRAVLMGGGKKAKRDARALEKLGALLYKTNANSGFKSLALHADSAENAAHIALGAQLAAYRFDDYRTKQKPDSLPSLQTLTLLVSDPKAARAAWKPLEASVQGTYLARDLVNLPPNDLYPASFAKRLKAL